MCVENEKISPEQKDKEGIKADWMRLFLKLLCLAAVIWLLVTQLLLITQAPDNDMFPAVKAGDLLVGFRRQKSYVKEDVVIYQCDGNLKVGRVMGKASDRIELDDSGILYVNGTEQNGDIMYPTYAQPDEEYPLTVPEGCVYILGDYRTQAADSRKLGCIPLENVKAKVITILRRRNL